MLTLLSHTSEVFPSPTVLAGVMAMQWLILLHQTWMKAALSLLKSMGLLWPCQAWSTIRHFVPIRKVLNDEGNSCRRLVNGTEMWMMHGEENFLSSFHLSAHPHHLPPPRCTFPPLPLARYVTASGVATARHVQRQLESGKQAAHAFALFTARVNWLPSRTPDPC